MGTRLPHHHNPRAGLSLIELMVASIVFLVIFMGLASAYQSAIIVNQASIGLTNCLRTYQDGMRLLERGEPGSPRSGLRFAHSASIQPNGHLLYATRTAEYEVWTQNGVLLRRRVQPPGPQLILMGDPPTVPPTKGVVVMPDTAPLLPVGVEIPSDGPAKGVYFPNMRLFYDLDGDRTIDENEMEITLRPSVFLRNSGP